MRPLGPYIVIGVGRCGTSSVSRILHTRFDVCMGDHFTKNEITNPDGTWEDVVFWNMHRHLVNDKLSLNQWIQSIQHIIHIHEKRGVPWGWKDPVTVSLLGFYLMFFETTPRIIRCNRDKTLVLKSIKKNWKNDDDIALTKYTSSTNCMDRLLRHIDHLVIDFSKDRLSDDDIARQITNKWSDI